MEILDSATNVHEQCIHPLKKKLQIHRSNKNSGSKWLLGSQVFIRTQYSLEAFYEVKFHKHFKSSPSISHKFSRFYELRWNVPSERFALPELLWTASVNSVWPFAGIRRKLHCSFKLKTCKSIAVVLLWSSSNSIWSRQLDIWRRSRPLREECATCQQASVKPTSITWICRVDWHAGWKISDTLHKLCYYIRGQQAVSWTSFQSFLWCSWTSRVCLMVPRFLFCFVFKLENRFLTKTAKPIAGMLGNDRIHVFFEVLTKYIYIY